MRVADAVSTICAAEVGSAVWEADGSSGGNTASGGETAGLELLRPEIPSTTAAPPTFS